MRHIAICAVLTVAPLFLLTACGPAGTSSSAPNQADLCEVNSIQNKDAFAACKPGQKIVFLPPSFGNEQLPVIFAALYCDLRQTVALTTGAVTCIYQPASAKTEANKEQKKN